MQHLGLKRNAYFGKNLWAKLKWWIPDIYFVEICNRQLKFWRKFPVFSVNLQLFVPLTVQLTKLSTHTNFLKLDKYTNCKAKYFVLRTKYKFFVQVCRCKLSLGLHSTCIAELSLAYFYCRRTVRKLNKLFCFVLLWFYRTPANRCNKKKISRSRRRPYSAVLVCFVVYYRTRGLIVWGRGNVEWVSRV